jgi:hypothetical protein
MHACIVFDTHRALHRTGLVAHTALLYFLLACGPNVMPHDIPEFTLLLPPGTLASVQQFRAQHDVLRDTRRDIPR